MSAPCENDPPNPNTGNVDVDIPVEDTLKEYVNTTEFDTELTTKTTIGILIHFWSYVRKYFITGNLESLELPILSHENESGTFKGGDSGSLIVSSLSQFVGLLTSRTNKGTHGSNITFATLFK
ncbi:hypothetical protein DXG03_005227 [Asterophora parasitica]|uniref:Uncharacterized protein n=1 Tax=Asterophora parasitica TaxID=117018 RepID=A0A9P7G242_9AGAR|nr:hypothetical protein DXG03_005227 [Asterophora parasitica]